MTGLSIAFIIGQMLYVMRYVKHPEKEEETE
jgi:hypothetical protein